MAYMEGMRGGELQDCYLRMWVGRRCFRSLVVDAFIAVSCPLLLLFIVPQADLKFVVCTVLM